MSIAETIQSLKSNEHAEVDRITFGGRLAYTVRVSCDDLEAMSYTAYLLDEHGVFCTEMHVRNLRAPAFAKVVRSWTLVVTDDSQEA
jgi:hypothetical protein